MTVCVSGHRFTTRNPGLLTASTASPPQTTRKRRSEPQQTEFQPRDHVTSAKPTSVISTSTGSAHRASSPLCPSGALLGLAAMADQMVAPPPQLTSSSTSSACVTAVSSSTSPSHTHTHTHIYTNAHTKTHLTYRDACCLDIPV